MFACLVAMPVGSSQDFVVIVSLPWFCIEQAGVMMLMCSGPPVWLHTVDEDIYEALGSSTSLPMPQDTALSEDSSTRDIGDWGERLVFNYLQAVVVRYCA